MEEEELVTQEDELAQLPLLFLSRNGIRRRLYAAAFSFFVLGTNSSHVQASHHLSSLSSKCICLKSHALVFST